MRETVKNGREYSRILLTGVQQRGGCGVQHGVRRRVVRKVRHLHGRKDGVDRDGTVATEDRPDVRAYLETMVGKGDTVALLAVSRWKSAAVVQEIQRDAERRDLTEVIEDRAERASTLIASQLPVTDWHAVIGDANQADAICDRLAHDAHRIELQGRSMRRTHRAPKTRTPETR